MLNEMLVRHRVWTICLLAVAAEVPAAEPTRSGSAAVLIRRLNGFGRFGGSSPAVRLAVGQVISDISRYMIEAVRPAVV